MPRRNPNPLPAAEVALLRIELEDTDPPIWREVEVPMTHTLADLHPVIQAAMGWDDEHPWDFRVGDRLYGHVEGDLPGWGGPKPRDPGKVTLAALAEERRKVLTYTYDFGDNWEHKVRIVRRRPAEPGLAYPRLVGGERACPPEDSGGVWGYYDKLAILEDPEDPDHDEIRDWMGDDFDPERFDAETAAARLEGRLPPEGRRRGAPPRLTVSLDDDDEAFDFDIEDDDLFAEAYDPMTGPDAEIWPALDEDERIEAVEAWHRRAGEALSNITVHASLHMAVESQIAMGDEMPVRATLERLMRQGLDRHDAVHAIGAVLAGEMFQRLQDPEEAEPDMERYYDALGRLTPQSWREDDGPDPDEPSLRPRRGGKKR